MVARQKDTVRKRKLKFFNLILNWHATILRAQTTSLCTIRAYGWSYDAFVFLVCSSISAFVHPLNMDSKPQ